MPHVITHDKRVNLMANIRAAREALDARIRVGGNWKAAASAARELGHLLDQLAEWDSEADAQRQPRTRYIAGPAKRVRRGPPPPQREPLPPGKRFTVVEIGP